MKVFGRILAVLIAGVVSVIAVQQVIRRIYQGLGRRYIELPGEDGEPGGPR